MSDKGESRAQQDVDRLFAEALRRHKLGLTAEAEDLYQQILKLQPDNVNSHHFLGLCRLQQGDAAGALPWFDRTIKLAPAYQAAYANRAAAYRKIGRLDDAVRDLERVISLSPTHLGAHLALAAIHLESGRLQLALTSYETILSLAPERSDAWLNRGNLLRLLDRRREALDAYDQALAIEPDAADLLSNRATVMFELGRFEEAVADYERALVLAPDTPEVEGQALHARMQTCDWRDFNARCESIRAGLGLGRNPILPFSFLAIPGSEAQRLQCATAHAADFPPAADSLAQSVRYGHQRIRIGYFSADFHNHATAHLMAGLLERHDHSRFEIIGFSYGPPKDDPWRRRLIKAFDRLIDVSTWSDRQIAEAARELEIDIAVDLKGYTQDARSGIFAFRPAPVQASYLGYPGTLGANYIDYVIADDVVIPLEHRRFYSERVVSLPHSYQVNDSTKVTAEARFTRADLGLPETGFVFCCFNNNYKITPDVFDVWMRLLREVDDSVLWLLAGNESARKNLCREAQKQGVQAERLVFAQRMELSDHVSRHRQADLFLDTFHYNAHTTASDALWAGLPVVTCLGNTFAGRVAASLLSAVGLPELIAADPQAYYSRALQLANDRDYLAMLREKLTANRLSEPLFDTALFTEHLEAAFVAMWQRHEAGLAVESFAVEKR